MGEDGDGNVFVQIGKDLMRWNGEHFSPAALARREQMDILFQFKKNSGVWFLDGNTVRKHENGRETIHLQRRFQTLYFRTTGG